MEAADPQQWLKKKVGRAERGHRICLIYSYFSSQCCCNKLPQTWWLKITKMYSLTVPEAKSLKSRYEQSSETSRGNPISWLFQLQVAPGSPWLVAASLRSLLLWSHCLLFSVCLLIRTLVIGFKAHLDNPG